jgi:LemA protein
MTATAPSEKAAADANLTGALKTLFATSENYPELKANTNFLQLQTELSDIENQIAGSRRYYNATIKEYNNAVMIFPNNIIANMFGYKSETSYFSITEAEKQAPKVQF